MKKISREEQMMKNGGVNWMDRWVAQCTYSKCGKAWSSDKKRKDVTDKAYAHYNYWHKKGQTHRWNWIRDNGR